MNTVIDFDIVISRFGTHASKYDNNLLYLGTNDVIPLSVADMDFAAPPQVMEALLQRAAHPIYGYTIYPESLYQVFIDWIQKRHGWTIKREWIVLSAGIVPALFCSVLAYTQQGDGVIIQPPVYQPFFDAIKTNNRQLIENPLVLNNGRYEIDFEHLEACAKKARLLLLCSPHNPVGRVFNQEELAHVLDIAQRHDLIVFSDEIHADLLFAPHKHYPLGQFDTERVLTAFAPSKTFNIAGMNLSALIIPNETHRKAIQQVFDSVHIGSANPFSITAFEAAYQYGEPWLEQLLSYLTANKNLVAEFLKKETPQIQLIEPEGTFLLWLDCKALGLTDAQLKDFFVYKAKCGIIPGLVFGRNGSGFVRLNIAAPRSIIELVLRQIKVAMNSL
ncbi:MAG: PatB family C-S lyase [Methylococcaceae bacterium]